MRARRRPRPQLGIQCSSSPRWARGAGGLFLGAATGAVLGVFVGGVVGLRKLSGPGSEVEPLRAAMITAFGLTLTGAVVGVTAGALPPEC